MDARIVSHAEALGEVLRKGSATSGDGLEPGVTSAVDCVISLLAMPQFRHGNIECEWQPDSARAECGQCRRSFNLFRRRHHCRSCGGLMCSKCVKAQHALPGYPCTEPQVSGLGWCRLVVHAHTRGGPGT